MEFEKTSRNQVKRVPKRGHYDRETIYEVLDASYLCHAGFVVADQPYVIPTLYGREQDELYLHGSAASRMLKELSQGIPVCLTVTHVDGLVLARSAFHHSINYRSAVVFGTAVEVAEDEKEHGLFVISEQVLKGRWDESRKPYAQELKATTVLKMTIDSGSAKIRTGPPVDEEEDHNLPIWAGVVPLNSSYGTPQPDVQLKDGVETPESVRSLF